MDERDVYNRCLFCNHDYGSPGYAASYYTTLTAECGCTGVGEDCASQRPARSRGNVRVFGCRRTGQNCYKCRKP